MKPSPSGRGSGKVPNFTSSSEGANVSVSGRAEPHRGRVVEASLVRRSAELAYSCTVRISGEAGTAESQMDCCINDHSSSSSC